MNNNKLCITFAGAVGSSKTPISNYISTKLNFPIFNNDAIRSEVIEDLGVLDKKEHRKRRNTRLKEVLINGNSFICDISVDREWKEFKEMLKLHNYKYIIISLDLSKEFLIKLYKAKKYFDSLKRIDKLLEEHKLFLEQYSNDIDIHISDKDFKDRLNVSYDILKEYIN